MAYSLHPINSSQATMVLRISMSRRLTKFR